jgi:LysM repeat protein
MGSKAIAIIIAVGVGLLAGLGGIYLYTQGNGLPFGGGPETAATGDSSAPVPSSPKEATEATEPAPEPNVEAKATGAARPAAGPTAVPSFDVVLIDPSGEGVVAGRAAPGWQVSVQSGGTKVANATVNAQGEWSAVLDKPLPAGDHSLSLKITSPDGTRALSSQEWVRVEVGDGAQPAGATGTVAVPPQAENSAAPGAGAPSPGPAVAAAEPQGGVRATTPGAATSEPKPPKPTLVFRTVDYQDGGAAIGSVSITGTADPGATIAIYCDNEPLATVHADRSGIWRLVAEKKLGTGEHNFRAEQLNSSGAPQAQAMVAIERLVPKPPEVAAKPEAPKPGASSASADSSEAAKKDTYVIRRGDTLWAIAKRYLGSGLLYTTIFQGNRQVIDDPDLIHPKQELTVPAAEPGSN